MSEPTDSQEPKEEQKSPEPVATAPVAVAPEQPKEAVPSPEAPKTEAKREDKAPEMPHEFKLPANAAEQVGCIVFGNQLGRVFWTDAAKNDGYVVVDRGGYVQLHRDKDKKTVEVKAKAPEAKKPEHKKPATA